MGKETKIEALVKLLEALDDNEELTIEEIVARLNVSPATAAQFGYYITNLRIAYKGDKGFVPLVHPAVKQVALLKQEKLLLEQQLEAQKPALEFAKAFKAFLKD